MSAQKNPTIQTLEASLQYEFKDAALLERALTHRSWAHEQVGAGAEGAARQMHSEAMEFVGDSVLGMVVAEYLFRRHPELTEGELSRMKHRLVSTTSLCRVATRLDIGSYLRFGKGEEKTGGSRKRALLADSFEAVLAAIFFDAGIEAARDFVHRTLRPELEEATPEGAAAADTKTMLQERLQAESRSAPVYAVVETAGPAHRRTFHIEASWDGGCVRASGNSIKAAEMRAAKLALQQLDAGAIEENSSSTAA